MQVPPPPQPHQTTSSSHLHSQKSLQQSHPSLQSLKYSPKTRTPPSLYSPRKTPPPTSPPNLKLIRQTQSPCEWKTGNHAISRVHELGAFFFGCTSADGFKEIHPFDNFEPVPGDVDCLAFFSETGRAVDYCDGVSGFGEPVGEDGATNSGA